MQTRQIHLIRHGRVENPDGILYGRLSGFHLAESGVRSAEARARAMVATGRRIDHLLSSPLERALESARPFAEHFDLPIQIRDELIEASSHLEGGHYDVSLKILTKPEAWKFLFNPLRPSWGEPYAQVAKRMMSELRFAADLPGTGDVVLVSHQLPIWMVHRAVHGQRLAHDPRRRRCALSSMTSITFDGAGFTELSYRED